MNTLIQQLPVNLATNLRFLRERRGLTQQRLSELCEIPRSTLANLETGAGNPTLAILGQIAAALQISLEELLSAPRGQGKLHKRGTLPSEKKGAGSLPDDFRG